MRLLAYSAVTVVALASSPSLADGGLDGRGWSRMSTEQRRGFVAGHMDCAVSDDGAAGYVGVGPASLASAIDSQFKSHPGSAGRMVADVLREVLPRLTRARRPAAPQERPEEHPGKHGFFDGEYWRKSTVEHRLGFLTGYVECWSASASRDVSYPKSPAWYSERITAWYGISADGSDLRLDRASVGIADVLRVVEKGPGSGRP